MLSQLYVDMDQVLVNWERGVSDFYDLIPIEHGEQFDEYLANNRLDMGRVWQEVADSEKFWTALPLLPAAKKLVNGLQRLGRVIILSSCGDTIGIRAKAKEDWLIKHGFGQLLFIPLQDKELLSGKNRYLIDDRDDNVTKWVDAGGVGILFPTTKDGVTHAESVKWTLERIRAKESNEKKLHRYLPDTGE